jgi:hypothetical protein
MLRSVSGIHAGLLAFMPVSNSSGEQGLAGIGRVYWQRGSTARSEDPTRRAFSDTNKSENH